MISSSLLNSKNHAHSRKVLSPVLVRFADSISLLIRQTARNLFRGWFIGLIPKTCKAGVVVCYALHGFCAVLKPVSVFLNHTGYVLLSFTAEAVGFGSVVVKDDSDCVHGVTLPFLQACLLLSECSY